MELKESVKALGMENLDFDGCSEIYVKSLDDWDKFSNVSQAFVNRLVRQNTDISVNIRTQSL